MIELIRTFFYLTFLFLCFILNLSGQVKNQNDSSLKVGGEAVFLRVGVNDPLNRNVMGLQKEHFRIFEDKIEQEIVHFEQKESPISVGFILDTSSSMRERIDVEKTTATILHSLKNSKFQDEYFLVTFDKTTRLVKDLRKQSSSLDSVIEQSGGNTTLFDAVYLGLSKAMDGANENKAIILITDGEDNSSRYSSREVREFAKESSVQIYSIGQLGHFGNGMSMIREIAEITGGRLFFPSNFNELNYYIDLILNELRNQYVLGYKSTNQTRDGKWRRIKVELDVPNRLPKLKVHAREGYYAPQY